MLSKLHVRQGMKWDFEERELCHREQRVRLNRLPLVSPVCFGHFLIIPFFSFSCLRFSFLFPNPSDSSTSPHLQEHRHDGG